MGRIQRKRFCVRDILIVKQQLVKDRVHPLQKAVSFSSREISADREKNYEEYSEQIRHVDLFGADPFGLQQRTFWNVLT